ncbi:SMI1/KNR4 family protein [Streptomyces sp. NPDC048560]|uniref:SMI1/KNR4 family protein n=1 Tax=Streptomyces sp. NPDC048560 TaxID=3155488 RepID=UPI003435DDAE
MEDAISSAIALLGEAFAAEARRRPLGWEGLRSWEDEHGVVLPEPYRTFAAEIANGTTEGPTYEGGLLPLGAKPDSWVSWKADCWMSPQPFDGTAVRKPDRPFPLAGEWQWEYEYYDHALHSSPLHETYQHGSVLLGSDQPGDYWTLVVTGPQRGQVWWLRDGCATPYSSSGELGVGFLDWVRDWHLGQGWWRSE